MLFRPLVLLSGTDCRVIDGLLGYILEVLLGFLGSGRVVEDILRTLSSSVAFGATWTELTDLETSWLGDISCNVALDIFSTGEPFGILLVCGCSAVTLSSRNGSN